MEEKETSKLNLSATDSHSFDKRGISRC